MHLAIGASHVPKFQASRVHEAPNTNPSTYALRVAYQAKYGLDASIACSYTALPKLKSSHIHSPRAYLACAAACARENRLSWR